MRAFPSHEFAIGRTWPFLFLEDPRAYGHVPIDDAGPQAGPADNLANLARLSHRCHGLQDPGVAAAELAGLHNRTRSRVRAIANFEQRRSRNLNTPGEARVDYSSGFLRWCPGAKTLA